MTFKLIERFALESTKVNGDTYRVRLISPGQGSSGAYSAEMLREYAAQALPKGTKLYYDHTDNDDEEKRGGTRSIRDVAGRVLNTPVYEDGDASGAYANVKFVPEIIPLVETMEEDIGLSIEVHAGKKDADGNITELNYHPLNSIAVVTEPGRDGRILQKVEESFRAKASEQVNDNEGTDMPLTKEDIEAVASRTAEILAEALKPDPNDAAPETDVTALIEKVQKAKLPSELVEFVVEAAKNGEDVDAAIAKQLKLVEAIRGPKEDKEQEAPGVFSEGANDDNPKPRNDKERGASYMERIATKKAGK